MTLAIQLPPVRRRHLKQPNPRYLSVSAQPLKKQPKPKYAKRVPMHMASQATKKQPIKLAKKAGIKTRVSDGFIKTTKQVEAVTLLSSNAKYILLEGGSRSGKTFILIYAIFVRALKAPKSRHCILRLRFNHAKTSLWYDTIPKVVETCWPHLKDKIVFNKSDWFIKLPNGSEIWIGGLDDKERVDKILGNEYVTMYFNECSQIAYRSMKTALSRLAQKVEGLKLKAYFDLNPPGKRHWAYKLFHLLKDPDTNIPVKKPKLYNWMRLNPADNIENVADDYIEDVLGEMTGRQRKRFLEGQWLDDIEGALFTSENLNKHRLTWDQIPKDMERIAVGVDPAGSSKKAANETGIIPVGKCGNDYYILGDDTAKGKPAKWGERVVECYQDYEADKVVGEKNYGGEMVEHTIMTFDESVPYGDVHATRGKRVRAEPVSALAEKGRLHIVGHLPELEDEMVSWIPPGSEDESDWSPNRMDAMVWGVIELMGGPMKKSVGVWG
jgi:hypothetical protein